SENRVREAKHQNILRGFFAEKMIDAVGLLFRKRISDDSVQLARRLQIRSEWFFNDYARPASFARLIQIGRFQVLENWFELIRTRRNVKEPIAPRAVVLVNFIQAFGQALVAGRVAKLALVIRNGLRKGIPDFIAH